MSPLLRTSTARRTSRPVRAAGAALVLALGLTGCGAGLQAQTYQERTVSDSTNEAIGAIAVRNIRVLPPEGPTPYPVYEIGEDATVLMSLINRGIEDDRLVSVSTPAAQSVELVDIDGRPTDGRVPGQSGIVQYALRLNDVTQVLRPGNYIALQMVFAENGTLELMVPVALTNIPGPRREGYHVAPLDSEGVPIVEEEELEADDTEQGGITSRGQQGSGNVDEESGNGVGAESDAQVEGQITGEDIGDIEGDVPPGAPVE